MPINLQNYQQVTTTDNTPITKWIPADMPEFIGTFKGEQVIEFKGDKFTRLMFTNAINNDNDQPIEGNLSCKDYAQLKMKMKGMEGKRVGITWNGEKPHPKFPAKTMHTFSVHILPAELPLMDETEDTPF